MVHDNFFMHDITACKSHRGVKQLLTEDVKSVTQLVHNWIEHSVNGRKRPSTMPYQALEDF
jgi:hypothetical protein